MSSRHLAQASEGSSSTSETPRPVVHGSFSVSFDFLVPSAQAFLAFAEPSLRTRWFRLPGSSKNAHHELDFRVGGGEVARNVFVSGDVKEFLEYRSRFLDIVLDERIVFVYEAHVNGRRRWVSLVTVELAAQDTGSRLVWTEQYAYLDLTGDGSQDVAHLRGGTRLILNGLSTVVEPDRYKNLVETRPEAFQGGSGPFPAVS